MGLRAWQKGGRSRRGVVPSGEPYLYYPALNMLTIPFHEGSGPWGAQRRIEPPIAPTITGQVTVTTEAEWLLHNTTPNLRIIIPASVTIAPTTGLYVRASDVEVVYEDGAVNTGYQAIPDEHSRVVIRSAAGVTTRPRVVGGVNVINVTGLPKTDIRVQDMDLGGLAGQPGFSTQNLTDRGCLVGCRVRSDSNLQAFRLRFTSGFVAAGNTVLGTVTPPPQAFTVEAGTAIACFQNDIRNDISGNLGCSGAIGYLWLHDNTLVGINGGAVYNMTGVEAGWFLGNRLWSQGGAGPNISATTSLYMRITDNEFRVQNPSFTETLHDNAQAAGDSHVPPRDWVVAAADQALITDAGWNVPPGWMTPPGAPP